MSFAHERKVRATRKEHRCDGCGQPIPKGAAATRWSGMTDGDFGSAIYHLDCREAEVALNHEAGCGAEDWSSLNDFISDGAEEWLRAEYPAVAERMCDSIKQRG